jgi:surface antigen
VAGNAIASDINCDDRPYAFRVYQQGFNGPLGQRYDWRDDQTGHYGYFIAVSEFQDGPYLCRDFREGIWHRDHWKERTGTACRQDDGVWRFR